MGRSLINRIEGGITMGDPAFFQLLYSGGGTNLHGFRNYRFAGERMAYHNLELRLKQFDFSSYLLPGTFGLAGYGDGFYLVPAQMFVPATGRSRHA